MRRATTERKWVAALVLAVFAAAVAWGVASAPPPAVVEPPPYPELFDADRSLVAELSAAWGDAMPAPFADYTPESERRRVLEVLDRDPGRAAFPLLAVLHERQFSRRGAVFFITSSSSDEDGEWAGCWLRDHPDDATTSLMCRMVADQRVDTQFRHTLVVALSRPGDSRTESTLVDVATDDRQPHGFREFVLRRIARCGGPAPRRLRDLLYVPFERIAGTTAVVLLEWGDPEAPSLLVDEFRRAVDRDDDSSRALSAGALRLLVADDADLAACLADDSKMLHPHKSTGGRDVFERPTADKRARFRAIADDVSAWIDAHPHAGDTDFERGRREYLAGPQRKRELATTSLDVVLVAGENDFDLAAALLVPDNVGGFAGVRLDQLDRLARLVRRDVGPSPTPSAWIDALNRRLLSSPRVLAYGRDLSDLGDVMAGGCGNCMGLSSLYLAVAERLELPIRGVEAPAHVFVRWDDGTFRRNIEATERGVEHDDRWYATRGDGLSIRDEDVKSGAYLSNISKRRFLALALVNRSDSEAKAGRAARAVEDAEWAVRLAPELANARVDRASRLTDTDPARAAEDLRAAEKSRRLSPGESMVATDTYVKLGLVDDAIRLADAACVAYPADVGVTLRRANALACARRFDLARRAIDDLPDDARKRPDVRLADVELGFVAGDSSWRDRLADAVEDPVEDPRIHLVLAEHLLDGIAGAAPSPSDATYVLDLVARITLPRTLRSSSDFREAMTRSAAIHDEIGHPKRRYYELRVRCARALHDEAGVAAAESALRDIDAKK